MTIDNETIRTICWSVVFVFGIQGLVIYSIVKVIATGRAAIFERRDSHDRSGRGGAVVGISER